MKRIPIQHAKRKKCDVVVQVFEGPKAKQVCHVNPAWSTSIPYSHPPDMAENSKVFSVLMNAHFLDIVGVSPSSDCSSDPYYIVFDGKSTGDPEISSVANTSQAAKRPPRREIIWNASGFSKSSLSDISQTYDNVIFNDIVKGIVEKKSTFTPDAFRNGGPNIPAAISNERCGCAENFLPAPSIIPQPIVPIFCQLVHCWILHKNIILEAPLFVVLHSTAVTYVENQKPQRA
ncbi:hypothetical protein BT96DRAFT_988010 [Gymnopus androsaceus JB14]|uniref:Uncharacterized protein n=1 Tax=Gymnopus androsaceus JB14 TaxID=1447944 RepID=A0A6A4IAD3_9AGAR|nr:hypothetical protein BT96DRAFT_988010 [Gymnopus androsaceus JB14]